MTTSIGTRAPPNEDERKRVAELERRLGFGLADVHATLSALTHTSYVNEHRDQGHVDNERLEFLGDAVLGLAISHRLMERCPGAREGELSRLRAAIVNEEGLATVSRALGLGSLLLLGRGEERSGGRDKPSLLADALEAVIGAVYRSGGLPLAMRMIDVLFGEALDRAAQGNIGGDFKTRLQQMAQGSLGSQPGYRVIAEQGPDHSKTFTVEVEIKGALYGVGQGRTKKDAEQAAAREGIAKLGLERPRTPKSEDAAPVSAAEKQADEQGAATPKPRKRRGDD